MLWRAAMPAPSISPRTAVFCIRSARRSQIHWTQSRIPNSKITRNCMVKNRWGTRWSTIQNSGTRTLINHKIHVAIITPYFRFMLHSPLQTAAFQQQLSSRACNRHLYLHDDRQDHRAAFGLGIDEVGQNITQLGFQRSPFLEVPCVAVVQHSRHDIACLVHEFFRLPHIDKTAGDNVRSLPLRHWLPVRCRSLQ